MIKTQIKIGKNTIQAEFNDMKSVHKFGAVYGNLPEKCDACGDGNLFLSHKNPKGNDYFMIECGKCGATANFGIHNNESKSLYWKREKMAVFQGNGQQSAPQNNQQSNADFEAGAFTNDNQEVSF